MVLKFFRFTIGLSLSFLLLTSGVVLAEETPAPASAPTSNATSTTVYNKTVNRVSDCTSEPFGSGENETYREPLNCIYLLEPIGGRPNYDLFKITCGGTMKGCNYELWGGEAITGSSHGPVQAILSFTPERVGEQGFTLLYNYAGLIYKYLSGIIVGMSVLFVIVGGVEITTAGGEAEGLEKGKKRITHAIVGMIVWFLASLILYTINPTFFAY